MADAFALDWLALRETADARARDEGLAQRLSVWLERRLEERGSPALRVLDLGAGAGNNLRWLAPRLPGVQTWVLFDADADLLAAAAREAPESVAVETRTGDLATDADALAAEVMAGSFDLVTASALFDLAGADWIDALARRLAEARTPLLAALSYDGRQSWSPPHPLDAAIKAAFDADQTRDKGLGPALGPAAHAHLASALRDLGLTVVEADSDWVLAAGHDAALIAELARGTAAALAPALGRDAEDWGRAHASAAAVVIGHKDLLALPPG